MTPFMKTRKKTYTCICLYIQRRAAGQTQKKAVTVTVPGEVHWVAGGKGEREPLLFRNFWISNQVQINQNKQKQLTMLVEPLAQEQVISKTWWFS